MGQGQAKMMLIEYFTIEDKKAEISHFRHVREHYSIWYIYSIQCPICTFDGKFKKRIENTRENAWYSRG